MRLKRIIMVLLLTVVMATQSGCVALALGALTGAALGNMANNAERQRAEEARRVAEEQRRQQEHELRMLKLEQSNGQ